MNDRTTAYIGVGSNLDDPARRVAEAGAALGALPETELRARSQRYGSRPLGPVVQPDFVNAVVAVNTGLPLRSFFDHLRVLEAKLGRRPPRERWGPRHIDLDLLVFGDQCVDEAELRVPHPGISVRNFVLVPLAEIAPDLIVPGVGRVADLARKAGSEGLWLIDRPRSCA